MGPVGRTRLAGQVFFLTNKEYCGKSKVLYERVNFFRWFDNKVVNIDSNLGVLILGKNF